MAVCRPPGRGNGSDPELLDSPMGLFHYPSPGGSAEVALDAAFSYNIHGCKTSHNE